MRATPRQLESLVTSLHELRRRALDLESAFARELARVHPDQAASARNLLHYLALRQSDLRPLQGELASLGLSSLGRMEPHALATLDAVLWAVQTLAGVKIPPIEEQEAPCDFAASGPARLNSNARTLLGPEPFRCPVRIMVTMPSEAATNEATARRLDACRDGRDAHQLRARRRVRVAQHSREPAQRRAHRRPEVPRPGRPRRAEAAHRPPSAPSVISCASSRERDRMGRVVKPAKGG